MDILRELCLFAGSGGPAVALEPWCRPVAYCEADPWCQGVLMSRMAGGSIPWAPVWDDVRTLRGDMLPRVDVVTAGWPCQDISLAGRGGGLGGKRSGLFFDVVRLLDETGAPFVFLENSPGIRTRGGERVVKELASRGYDVRWDVFAASAVGAWQRRKRWFLAGFNRERLRERRERRPQGKTEADRLFEYDGGDRPMADAHGEGELRQAEAGDQTGNRFDDGPSRAGRGARRERDLHGQARQAALRGDWWASEPGVDRVVYGLPHRVDRVRAMGNAWVPAQARLAFQTLFGVG